MHELNTGGCGVFLFENFLGGVADTVATGEQRPAYGPFSVDCDDDTVFAFKASELNGYLDGETDGDDNDAFALFTEPMCKIDLNTGQEVWFEARLEVGAVADQGVFVGMAEEAALSRDVIADDAGATIGESYFGFRLLATDTDAFDAVYKLDAGTEVEVLADVTNATAIASADRASVAADTEIKLGMYFNGGDELSYYVNGIKVATATLATSTFPNGVNMAPIVSLKTGTAAAQSIAVDWIAAAYQLV
jgi:hypothetical protein